MAYNKIEPDYDFERAQPQKESGASDFEKFYQRMASDMNKQRPNLCNRFYQDPGAPVFRAGRVGAPWRHIRQTTGNMGNNICFVDGVVKQSDMKKYPPFGSVDADVEALAFISPSRSELNLGQRMSPLKSANYSTYTYTPKDSDINRYKTSYNKRAQNGFKYWYEEVPYQGLPAKQSISGSLMAKGIGC